MILNCLIYTTSSEGFFDDVLPTVRDSLLQSKGLESVNFTIKPIKAPDYESIVTIRDRDGDARFSWDWIHQRFVVPVEGDYNAVCFHFTKYYKDKYKLSKRINGSYHNNDDETMDFWICADPEKAAYYEFPEAARLLIHELGHGFARWTGEHNEEVHLYDYQLHKIDEFHRLIDFYKWNMQKRMVSLLTKVVELYNKLIWRH